MSPVQTDAAWAAIVAEASAWIAMMHGSERTPAAEEGLRRWLKEDPLHARAFELATDTWNEARASVKRGARVKVIVPGERGGDAPSGWRPWPMLTAAASVLGVVAAGVWVLLDQSAITTRVGERRVLSLDDGSQITLNTDTEIIVDYSTVQRHLRLEKGEALFEVTREPARPFAVTAGGRTITAIGTSFVIRNEAQQLAVTLIDGKVAVAPAGTSALQAATPQTQTTVMMPGERLTFSRTSQRAKLDRPEIGKLTSWQQGKVHIEDLTLAQAIAEMNRYSTVHLEVEGEQAAQLHLSGVFRIGDSRNFANAVARTHGLGISEQGDRIVLTGVPGSAVAAP